MNVGMDKEQSKIYTKRLKEIITNKVKVSDSLDGDYFSPIIYVRLAEGEISWIFAKEVTLAELIVSKTGHIKVTWTKNGCYNSSKIMSYKFKRCHICSFEQSFSEYI